MKMRTFFENVVLTKVVSLFQTITPELVLSRKSRKFSKRARVYFSLIFPVKMLQFMTKSCNYSVIRVLFSAGPRRKVLF